MSRGVIFDDVTDTSGNALPSISVTIYEEGTFTKATLFDARTGGNNLDNPLTTNERGIFLAYLEPGSYDISVAAPTGTFVKPGVPALDPDDVNDLNENIDDINAALELLDDTGALNALQTVDTLAELQGVEAPSFGDKREFKGYVWEFEAGDFSSVLAVDDVGGLYVKATDTAATVGAWKRLYKGLPQSGWFGVIGDGITDDRPAMEKAIDVCILLDMRLEVELDKTVYLDTGISKTLAGASSDCNTFGIKCLGSIRPNGNITALRFIGGWNNKFTVRVNGGGTGGNATNSTALQLSGCYNDETIVFGTQYLGELLRYDNNHATNSGGDGRHRVSLFSENCGRAIRTEPGGATNNMNGFGRIDFLYDANSQIRCTFNRTQDIDIGYSNVDMGSVAGAAAGMAFTGCSSVHIQSIGIGEIGDPPSGLRANAFFIDDCEKVTIDRFFFIRETGAVNSTTRALAINSSSEIQVKEGKIEGVGAGHAIYLTQSKARPTSKVEIKLSLKNCDQRALQVDATVTGQDHVLDVITESCGWDGTTAYNVIDLANVSTRRWRIRNKSNNPNAASDMLIPAANRVVLNEDSTFTSGKVLPAAFMHGTTKREVVTGNASIPAGSFSDVVLPRLYKSVFATPEPGAAADTLIVDAYLTDASGYTNAVRIRNRSASASAIYSVQIFGCPAI